MSRVWKWVIPIDDGWHPVGAGPVALVDVQPDEGERRPTVTVWTIEPGPDEARHARELEKALGVTARVRKARVYATGEDFPGLCEHLGSCQDTIHELVWHVVGIWGTEA